MAEKHSTALRIEAGLLQAAADALCMATATSAGQGDAGPGADHLAAPSATAGHTLSLQAAAMSAGFFGNAMAVEHWARQAAAAVDAAAAVVAESVTPLPRASVEAIAAASAIWHQLELFAGRVVKEHRIVATDADVSCALCSTVPRKEVRSFAALSVEARASWLRDLARLLCGTLLFAWQDCAHQPTTTTDVRRPPQQLPGPLRGSLLPMEQSARVSRASRALTLELRGLVAQLGFTVELCESLALRTLQQGMSRGVGAPAVDHAVGRCEELLNRGQALSLLQSLLTAASDVGRQAEEGTQQLEDCFQQLSRELANPNAAVLREAVFPWFERADGAWRQLAAAERAEKQVSTALAALRRFLPAASVPGGVSHLPPVGVVMLSAGERQGAVDQLIATTVSRQQGRGTESPLAAAAAAGAPPWRVLPGCISKCSVARGAASPATAPHPGSHRRSLLLYGGFCPVALCAGGLGQDSGGQLDTAWTGLALGAAAGARQESDSCCHVQLQRQGADGAASACSHRVACCSPAAAAAYTAQPADYDEALVQLSARHPELLFLAGLSDSCSACGEPLHGTLAAVTAAGSGGSGVGASTSNAAENGQPEGGAADAEQRGVVWPPCLRVLQSSRGDVAAALAATAAATPQRSSQAVPAPPAASTSPWHPGRRNAGGRLVADAFTATPVHLHDEGHFDGEAPASASSHTAAGGHEWSEWALRRQAARLYQLSTSCATSSAQTVESHFRRTAETQVYPPKANTTQTRVSTGVNTERTVRVAVGLRGAREAAVAEHAARRRESGGPSEAAAAAPAVAIQLPVGPPPLLRPAVVSFTLPF